MDIDRKIGLITSMPKKSRSNLWNHQRWRGQCRDFVGISMGSTRQKDPKGSFIQKGTTEQQIFFDQWMEQGEEQMGGLFQQQKWRLNQSYWGDLLQTLDSKVIEVVEVRFLSPQSFSRPLESQASVPNLALPSTVMYCSTAVFLLLCNPYGVWLVVWNMFYFSIYWEQ